MKAFLKRIVVAILSLEARLVLMKHAPKIVAVIGSVGKTSTKDAIYTVLSEGRYVRKSEKSFNSDIGVPLTILGLPNAWSSPMGWFANILEGLHLILFSRDYPEWLVLEVGADRPRDISKLTWLRPHVLVYTRFPDVPVHVEFFDSPEAVRVEKRSLAPALRPEGTLIINADDPHMQHEAVEGGQHLLSYGFAQQAAIRGQEPQAHYEDGLPVGVKCTVVFQMQQHELLVRGALGTQHLYSALAALAVAASEGIRFEDAVVALQSHITPPGRMRIVRGGGGTILVDDTYNSSPVAVEVGLQTMTALHGTGRKVVVLGDMMELGDFSVQEHRRVGEHVAMMADVFVTIGIRMLAAAEAAQATQGRVTHIEPLQDINEAIRYLKGELKEGDIVYLKGSQSMRMEKIVAQLMHDPAAAVRELVRQEEEWQDR